MQGRARGREGERKTYHITIYHHITMEFGGYSLNVAKNPTRARARKGEAQGVLSYQKATGIFDNPHMLQHLLLPRPKLPKAIKVEREPLKGKSGKRHADREMDEDANGERFAWRKGKCKQTRCRFNHACATCGASDHHSGVCPRKDKGQAKKGRKVQGSRLWKWMRRSLQHLRPMRCWVWIFGQVKL